MLSNVKMCIRDSPHAIELLNKKYADVFTILRSYPELENYLSPFVDAWESDAQEPVSYTHLAR